MHIYAGEIYRSRQPYWWHRRCWLMSWRSRRRGGPALPPDGDKRLGIRSVPDQGWVPIWSLLSYIVGTKSVAIDKFKCNQGRPRCNKSDTVATTTTTSATTKFHCNTYMLLHLEARKEAIAPYVLQQCTKKFATQTRRCYIAVQKQPTLVWSP